MASTAFNPADFPAFAYLMYPDAVFTSGNTKRTGLDLFVSKYGEQTIKGKQGTTRYTGALSEDQYLALPAYIKPYFKQHNNTVTGKATYAFVDTPENRKGITSQVQTGLGEYYTLDKIQTYDLDAGFKRQISPQVPDQGLFGKKRDDQGEVIMKPNPEYYAYKDEWGNAPKTPVESPSPSAAGSTPSTSAANPSVTTSLGDGVVKTTTGDNTMYGMDTSTLLHDPTQVYRSAALAKQQYDTDVRQQQAAAQQQIREDLTAGNIPSGYEGLDITSILGGAPEYTTDADGNKKIVLSKDQLSNVVDYFMVDQSKKINQNTQLDHLTNIFADPMKDMSAGSRYNANTGNAYAQNPGSESWVSFPTAGATDLAHMLNTINRAYSGGATAYPKTTLKK